MIAPQDYEDCGSYMIDKAIAYIVTFVLGVLFGYIIFAHHYGLILPGP